MSLLKQDELGSIGAPVFSYKHYIFTDNQDRLLHSKGQMVSTEVVPFLSYCVLKSEKSNVFVKAVPTKTHHFCNYINVFAFIHRCNVFINELGHF